MSRWQKPQDLFSETHDKFPIIFTDTSKKLSRSFRHTFCQFFNFPAFPFGFQESLVCYRHCQLHKPLQIILSNSLFIFQLWLPPLFQNISLLMLVKSAVKESIYRSELELCIVIAIALSRIIFRESSNDRAKFKLDIKLANLLVWVTKLTYPRQLLVWTN